MCELEKTVVLVNLRCRLEVIFVDRGVQETLVTQEFNGFMDLARRNVG